MVFKESRKWNNKGVPIFFSFEIFSHNLQGTYDMVDMVWKIGNLYQGRRWLTWYTQGILGF